MPILKLDAEVIAQLSQATAPVELADSEGLSVGLFIPTPLQNSLDTREIIAEAERVVNTPQEWVPFIDIFRGWLRLATDPADQARLRQRIEELEEKDRCRGA